MLAGLDDTDTGRAHAEELLAAARAHRETDRRSAAGGTGDSRPGRRRRGPAPVPAEPAGPPSPGTAGSPGADRDPFRPCVAAPVRAPVRVLGFQLRADQDRADDRRRAALGRLRPLRRRCDDARGDLRPHPHPAAARPVHLGARRRRRRARQHRAVRAAGLRRATRRLGPGRAAQRDHPADDPAVRPAARADRADHRAPGRRAADRVRGRAVCPRGVARRRRRNHHGDPRLSRVDRLLRRHVRLHAALLRRPQRFRGGAVGGPAPLRERRARRRRPASSRDCRPGPPARRPSRCWRSARSARAGRTCSTSGSSAPQGPPSPPR